MIATPEERYAQLAEDLAGATGVTHATGKGFGSSALKVNNKIFAMLADGCLVVKLTAKRVTELVEDGSGERFEPGPGRVMKEWLAVNPESTVDWLELSREALAFVGRR